MGGKVTPWEREQRRWWYQIVRASEEKLRACA